MSQLAFEQAALAVAQQCHIWGDASHQIGVIREMMDAVLLTENDVVSDPTSAAYRIAANLDYGFSVN